MERRYDYLIVGSGIAGLFFALKVIAANDKAKIAIVTKKGETDTSTNRAQGGIAAVLSKADSFESHIRDTLKAGAGLCHKDVVERVVEDGPSTIAELVAYGVKFSREAGKYDLGREGGHGTSRVLHAGDLTGREIERALLAACRDRPNNIDIFRNHFVLDLIICQSQGEEVCAGAFVFGEQKREFSSFYATVTMLATGGLGQVYYHNTNPKIATGDGVAVAWRAGLPVANLEFIQFHPTVLYNPGRWPFLISETLRGEGGRLKSVDGRFIMDGAHEQADLAPRDIVARVIDRELKQSGEEYVLLDVSHLEESFLKKRFPNIYQECRRRGFDIAHRPIPVVPAAHYSCGGVVCRMDGQTDLPGLFVSGEVAMTGMHGANRLASNSLLEAVVVSRLAALRGAEYLKDFRLPENIVQDNSLFSSLKYPREKILIAHDRRQLCQVMSDFVGIVRSEERLRIAQSKIQQVAKAIEQYYLATPATYDVVELRNMATVAELIIRSALERKESRGLHSIEEYPNTDEAYQKDSILPAGKVLAGFNQ